MEEPRCPSPAFAQRAGPELGGFSDVSELPGLLGCSTNTHTRTCTLPQLLAVEGRGLFSEAARKGRCPRNPLCGDTGQHQTPSPFSSLHCGTQAPPLCFFLPLGRGWAWSVDPMHLVKLHGYLGLVAHCSGLWPHLCTGNSSREAQGSPLPILGGGFSPHRSDHP